jgi:hypothetical protein
VYIWTVSTVFKGLSYGLLASWIHSEVCAIIFPSNKGDADVCSIGVGLSYRKYMVYDHFVIRIDTWNYGSQTLAQAARRAGLEAVGFSRATRFVSRLVATDFLDWTGPERKAD